MHKAFSAVFREYDTVTTLYQIPSETAPLNLSKFPKLSKFDVERRGLPPGQRSYCCKLILRSEHFIETGLFLFWLVDRSEYTEDHLPL
ncbi:hypothetical protein VTN31DRAFT_3050 [Thermomyces dupontii]|uniref:uncharacterized protein n=1 Tax=Talaromyces thermophilus TaxID=28565 RepID=UPI0037441F24